MASFPLTVKGAEKLRAELHKLKTVERPAVILAIAEARAHGDLSENAEYDAAKEKQGFVEGRNLTIVSRSAEGQLDRLPALANDLVGQKVAAIFAAGDQMAIGAMHAAADAGLSVPRDLAVVGFDDIDAAALVRPALTTVAQDQRALGEAAVAALRSLLDDPGPVRAAHTADPRIVPTKLLVRESSRSGT